MRNCYIIALLLTFLGLPSASLAWECGGFTGTCERNLEREKTFYPSETRLCYHYQKDENGEMRLYIYCPYFQCDSNGDVLLHDNSLGAHVDERPYHHGMNNCGGYIGYQHRTGGCHANCCYFDGKFTMAINRGPARNLCCRTFQAYLDADCSLDDQYLTDIGTGGDFNGEGSLEDVDATRVDFTTKGVLEGSSNKNTLELMKEKAPNRLFTESKAFFEKRERGKSHSPVQ